ncbi:hypothetical protein FRC96_02885 [Lujinxingia vulgaris]|uniref:Uncharacterized protein n=1 Tax=Lujinxingia vulgaris TaxID=2600176 RepID=A0A5C6XSJ0_9DELT|nr:hypothetical protein [Lujinxingia vulgaris]TXD42843.1 hypothetical protein FRC96_02885 [Lujinxingia vulgaris]
MFGEKYNVFSGLSVCVLALALGVAACGEPLDEVQPAGELVEVCEEGGASHELFVDARLSTTGPLANDLAVGSSGLWVVESGANTLSLFDVERERYSAGAAALGSDRNPYAVAVEEGAAPSGAERLWVANYSAHSVSVVDGETGDIIAEMEHEALKNPSAVAVGERYVYVGNVNYLSVAEGFGEGSVAVISRDALEVVASVATAFKNPHSLSVEEVDGQEVLVVSAAGEVVFGGEGVTLRGEAGVELMRFGAEPTSPAVASYALGQREGSVVGAPGRPVRVPGTDRLYFSSATAPVLFAFDLGETRWLHDASNPVEVYAASGDATHSLAVDSAGRLWLTAFNQDALYVWDTRCDTLAAGPIPLGQVDDLVEGPQSVTIVEDAEGIDAYYLLSNASTLGRVRVQW